MRCLGRWWELRDWGPGFQDSEGQDLAGRLGSLEAADSRVEVLQFRGAPLE